MECSFSVPGSAYETCRSPPGELPGCSAVSAVVIDDFVPDEVLQEVDVREIPEPGNRDDWQRAERTDTIKLPMPRDWVLGPVTRQLLNQFKYAAVTIKFLERLTGINDLIPDPHYWGGGLHVIDRGGFLKIHANFNRHPDSSWTDGSTPFST